MFSAGTEAPGATRSLSPDTHSGTTIADRWAPPANGVAMTSIAAVIEVVERAVGRRRPLWVGPIAGPSKPREQLPRPVWVDIDLDALQWDDGCDWQTRPAVAFRGDTPAEADPPTVTRCHGVSVAESSTSGMSAVAAGA